MALALELESKRRKQEPSAFYIREKPDGEPAGTSGALMPSGGQDGNGVEVEKMELMGNDVLSYSSQERDWHCLWTCSSASVTLGPSLKPPGPHSVNGHTPTLFSEKLGPLGG